MRKLFPRDENSMVLEIQCRAEELHVDRKVRFASFLFKSPSQLTDLHGQNDDYTHQEQYLAKRIVSSPQASADILVPSTAILVIAPELSLR